MKVISVISVLALVALLSLAAVHAEVTCGQVDAALIPCIEYLTGRGDTPSPPCCAGVRAVKGLAVTTEDKRASCSCVKAAASGYAGLKDDAAQSLPTKCGVQMDIPISRGVDCDKWVVFKIYFFFFLFAYVHGFNFFWQFLELIFVFSYRIN